MNIGAVTAEAQKLNRILITADAVGGVWQYTLDLVRILVREGVDVLVATMGPRPTLQQQAQLSFGANLVCGDYALEWELHASHNVDDSSRWLLSLKKEFKPDLVHLNGYWHANLPWHCPIVVVAHSCVTSWWRRVHGDLPGPEWDDYQRRVRAGLAACDCIVAPSLFMGDEIRLLYGVSAKVKVIANYSSGDNLGNVSKEPFCLGVGRVWDEAKNFSVLRLAAERSSWPFYLAGANDGRVLAPLRSLGGRPHTEILELMARASLFVHPALYEPFGLAVLEAAKSRCCLVLADTPSSRELWDGAAVLVEARSPEAWSKTIADLIADPEERVRLGDLAFRHSFRYTEEQFRAEYLNTYAELLGKRSSDKEATA